MLYNIVNMLKITELYTLNEWIVLCVHYFLIKLLSFSKIKEERGIVTRRGFAALNTVSREG